MRLTRLITVRSIFTRRLRSFLTLFGILLGVASIYSINYTNQNAFRSISRFFEGTSGRVDLEVRNAVNVGGIPLDRLDTILAIEGVKDAVPVLKLPAALPGETPTEMDLNFFGTNAGGLILYGIDPLKDPDVRDYRITQGRFLDPASDEKQLVLVEEYAQDQEIEVGQTINVLTVNGPVRMNVVGFIAKEGVGLTNLGKFGVMTLPLAQELTNRPDEVDQFDIVADSSNSDPAFLDALRASLLSELGEEYAVVYPASQGDRMNQMLSGYQIGLNFMAGIALFVGSFLIYNAFSMTVVERTRELGLLRSVGMTRRQITSQVLFEGLFLGGLGAIAGALMGIAMSSGLMGLMSQILGQPLNAGEFQPDILIGSMAIGMVVTLLAALLPAFQAGKISPLEALRLRGKSDDGWLIRYGWMVGIILLVLSAGILIWNPFPYDVQFRLGSVTVFALFFGAMLIIPVTLKFWQCLVRLPFHILFGPLGEIGSRNLERAKKRTMLTCAALLVGVSMIVVTTGMTGSFTADLYAWMDAYIGGDVFVGAAVPLTYELKDELESLPGVEHAAPVRYIEIEWIHDEKIEKISFMAVEPTSYTAVTRFVFEDSDLDVDQALDEFKQGGSVFVSSVISEKFKIQTGDTLRIKTLENEQTVKVAGIILDFYNQGLTVTGNWSDMERWFGVNDVTTFFVKATSGVGVTETIRQIKDGYQENYQLIIESNQSIRKRADLLMRQTFSMFDVLGVLAVMVAALGVMNTLSMSVSERTREIGMLRSMGMTRFQIIRMILAEAGLLGIIGGILGLGFGILLTRIFLAAMGAMSGYDLEFVMPVKAMWFSVVVALATSQLAALFPAIRASRTPVLTAIHYE
ncbi:MAG TPA: hypothetical protein DCP62_09765 [Erysipelotrichaceae bacterium]|nr:MAG: hypothetical protein A2Y19_10330 [Firmicutes bacterium GWE2_51_13]HAM63899.1 hypothetical protein [Erysipelotrichaceae bacterium]